MLRELNYSLSLFKLDNLDIDTMCNNMLSFILTTIVVINTERVEMINAFHYKWHTYMLLNPSEWKY